jgi:hypothetical protein
VVSTTIISPLMPRSAGAVSRAARPRQSTVMRSASGSCSVSKGLAEAAVERGLERGDPLGAEPFVAAGHAGEAVEVGAVAWMRHDQRAVERKVGNLLAPEIERAEAQPQDHRLGRFAFAPRREHAAGEVARRLGHGFVVALVDGDLAARLRKRERLPKASDAGTYDVGGRGGAVRRAVAMHPCPFAGMNRIRFKGSPRCP